MDVKLKEVTAHIGCGRTAVMKIEEECFVTVTIENEHDGMSPVNLAKEPMLLVKALAEFRKVNREFEPRCQIAQGENQAIYYFKRIL